MKQWYALYVSLYLWLPDTSISFFSSNFDITGRETRQPEMSRTPEGVIGMSL